MSKQINKRTSELPKDMKQEVVIDMRGQNVSFLQKEQIKQKIIEKTNGILKAENIKFK